MLRTSHITFIMLWWGERDYSPAAEEIQVQEGQVMGPVTQLWPELKLGSGFSAPSLGSWLDNIIHLYLSRAYSASTVLHVVLSETSFDHCYSAVWAKVNPILQVRRLRPEQWVPWNSWMVVWQSWNLNLGFLIVGLGLVTTSLSSFCLLWLWT